MESDDSEVSDSDTTETESESSEYDTDSTVEWNYESDDDDINYMDTTYDIAVKPVENAPDLTNADDPWVHVTVDEDGDNDAQFDNTRSGTKHIYGGANPREKPRDFFDLMYTDRLWDIHARN